MYFERRFRVSANNLKEGASIFVVGNCPELGLWHHMKAVELSREISSEKNECIWSAIVKLPVNKKIEYRYFQAVIVEPNPLANGLSDARVILHWETHIKCRYLVENGDNNLDGSTIETFGHHGGTYKTQRGWLTDESVVQLKLCNNPIKIWKRRYRDKLFGVKVTPVEVNPMNTMSHVLEESTDDLPRNQIKTPLPFIEIAVLGASDNDFKSQEQFGTVYNPDDFIVFQAQMMNTDTVAYLLDLYIHEPNASDDAIPHHVGFCYILPSNMKHYMGMFNATVTNNNHQPVGQVAVEYLVVHPISDFTCDMTGSFSRYWKQTWKGIDVGHRGSGCSYIEPKYCSTVRENTLMSMMSAAQHGASIVEFDVHLSKDKIPVIYHDFHVKIAVNKKMVSESQDLIDIPVQDLTHNQLKLLKLFCKGHGVEEGYSLNEEHSPEELQSFPTLEQALKTIDTNVGFNIEIKAAMLLKDGTHELNSHFEWNMYLNSILRVVLTHGQDRRIIFSSFHPDICSMLRLKQNRYPILFLTMGVTDRYPPYMDPRTNTTLMAIHYARHADILGISAHSECLLQNPSFIQLAKDSGLVTFVWGDDTHDKAVVKKLKSLGVDAVIYDRIYEYSEEEVNKDIFTVEDKEDRKQLLKVAGYCSDSASDYNL